MKIVFCVKIKTHLKDSLYLVETFSISPEHSDAYHFLWFPEKNHPQKSIDVHVHVVQISSWEENWIFKMIKNLSTAPNITTMMKITLHSREVYNSTSSPLSLKTL